MHVRGNEPTGAIADLFNDMVNCSDEHSGSTTKSLGTTLLMDTVKRDDHYASINHANESYPWTWRILAYTSRYLPQQLVP
jgi:hypothetical protein